MSIFSPRRKKYFESLSDSDLIDEYDSIMNHIEHEGWEYDVSHKEKELEFVYSLLKSRGYLD